MVASELSGDLEWAMLLRLKNPIEAKAWLLHFAMEGVGTKEDILSVSRFSVVPLHTVGPLMLLPWSPSRTHARARAHVRTNKHTHTLQLIRLLCLFVIAEGDRWHWFQRGDDGNRSVL